MVPGYIQFENGVIIRMKVIKVEREWCEEEDTP
jgi:hypothetical protein